MHEEASRGRGRSKPVFIDCNYCILGLSFQCCIHPLQGECNAKPGIAVLVAMFQIDIPRTGYLQ
jgi:hypothetical protein